MSPEPAIQFDGVSFAYNGEPVLKDVSLVIEPRDFAWIVGPNGGGKTTLLKLMLGLVTPRSGKILINGKSPRQARRMIGYMPQQSRLDPQFPVDVLDVVLMGRLTNFSPIGIISRKDRAEALAVLEEVGLVDHYRRPFADLSGGQQRRVLIARAMAAGPELLLLDEPTANLDIRVEQDVYELLQRLNDHLTIVMVSHDPAFVSPFVKSVVCVNRSVHVHPTASIDEQIMDELYGRPIKLIRHDKHFE